MNNSLLNLMIADALTLAIMIAGILLSFAGERRSQTRLLTVLFLFLAFEIVMASISSLLIPEMADRHWMRTIGRYGEAIGLTWFLFSLTRRSPRAGSQELLSGDVPTAFWIVQFTEIKSEIGALKEEIQAIASRTPR